MTSRLPEPRLTQVYRLEATLGDPIDVGEVSSGRRRIVPLTGGTFAGSELNGVLLPAASARTGSSSCRTARPSATSATRCVVVYATYLVS